MQKWVWGREASQVDELTMLDNSVVTVVDENYAEGEDSKDDDNEDEDDDEG